MIKSFKIMESAKIRWRLVVVRCCVVLRLWMNFQILWDSGIRLKFIHLSWRWYGTRTHGRQGMERKEGIANNGATNCWCGCDWVMLLLSRVAVCLQKKIREKFIHIFRRLGCPLSVQAGWQMKSDVCFFLENVFSDLNLNWLFHYDRMVR